MKLMILKIRHIKSCETKLVGAINKRQAHTPITQKVLMSSADRRLMILIIRGKFQKGRIIPAVRAIFWYSIDYIFDGYRFIILSQKEKKASKITAQTG